MSKILKFEGSSDDTFGEYAVFGDDHDNCASCKPIVFEVWSGDTFMFYVIGQYAGTGTPGLWLIGIQPGDDPVTSEEKAIPEWRMWFERGDRAYSPRLCIEAPDDVRIVWHDPDQKNLER